MPCAFLQKNMETIRRYARKEEISLYMYGEIGREIQPGGGDCDECRAFIREQAAKPDEPQAEPARD